MKPQLKLTIGISLFIISLALLLNACKTSSRLQVSKQTTTSQHVEATTHVSQKSQSAESVQVQNNIATDTEEVTTWYDTSKPADPATGKPPVAKQQIKKSKQTDNSKSDLTKNSGNKIDSGSTLKADTKASTKEKEKSSHDSETSLSISWWVYLVAIVAILAALYFFCPPFKIIVDNVFRAIKSKWKKKQS